MKCFCMAAFNPNGSSRKEENLTIASHRLHLPKSQCQEVLRAEHCGLKESEGALPFETVPLLHEFDDGRSEDYLLPEQLPLPLEHPL